MKGGPTLEIVKLFILRRNHNPEWWDTGGGGEGLTEYKLKVHGLSLCAKF